jgi:uncharacterized BrkB/YihY/UPF0761 family membrane protein
MQQQPDTSRRDQIVLGITLSLLAGFWVFSKLVHQMMLHLYDLPLVKVFLSIYNSKPVMYLIILLVLGWPIILATRVRVRWMRWTIIVLCSITLLWFAGDEIHDYFVEPEPFIYFNF